MGQAKELLMKQQEEGWEGIGDKQVCPRCISDSAIKDFIKANAVEKLCSYCGRRGKKPIAAEIDEVIEFIAEGLHSEDATLEEACLDDSNEDVLEDLQKALSAHLWLNKSREGELKCDSLRYTWEAFAEQVKHRTRFVFFRVSSPDKMMWENEPHGILDSLRELVIEEELVTVIPAGRRFYRAQRHRRGEHLAGAKRLGAPPAEKASHNRMSPAGIPMLYVATDAKTASAEAPASDTTASAVTTAEFRNVRPLRILDLSSIPNVPSMFDENRYRRMPLIFLQHFAEEISKPISDEAVPYDYVPTQVVTEYFRHLFHLPTEEDPDPRQPLDGLAFRSSKNGGGINYTLFLDQSACAECDDEEGAVMVLTTTTKRKALPGWAKK